MSWPSRAWWASAYAGVEAKVRAAFRAEVAAGDRQQQARARAEEQEAIRRRLAGYEQMFSDIVRTGWHVPGGESEPTIRRGGRDTWFVE